MCGESLVVIIVCLSRCRFFFAVTINVLISFYTVEKPLDWKFLEALRDVFNQL